MLLHASVTDSLVTLATHIINDLGLAGVALLTLSSAVIIVPGTEATMLLSGFNVFHHHHTLIEVIVFGLIGDLVGASIAYAIGYYGSDWLERHGSKIHMGPERLAIAHGWFERFGVAAIPISRCVPLIRAIFPYAAGVSRVSYLKFLPLAVLGSIPWIAGLAVIGKAAGTDWNNWRHDLDYVDYVVLVLLIGAIAYYVVKRRGASRDAAAAG